MNNQQNKDDRQKAQDVRRVELGMLGVLLARYPVEAEEKLQKINTPDPPNATEKTLDLRE